MLMIARFRPSARPRHDVSKDAPEPIDRHRLCHVQVEARFGAPATIGGSGPARQSHEPDSMPESLSDGPRDLEIRRASGGPGRSARRSADVRARRRPQGGRPRPPRRRSPRTSRTDAASHGCRRGPRRRECAGAGRDAPWVECPRIRRLYEWRGDGHHLSEPCRAALARMAFGEQVAIPNPKYLWVNFQWIGHHLSAPAVSNRNVRCAHRPRV